jgi:2-dehydro-3-deoxy-D-gluconate 5-dehydrogenase
VTTEVIGLTKANFSLADRIALITGGGGGLGGAMAYALAAAGADIALCDVAPAGMEAIARQIETLGRRCITMTADLRQRAGIARIVQTVEETFGHLDIAVNSAGINIRKPALEYGEEEWDKIIDINLKALFFCCQEEACAMLRAGKGKIINISSLCVENGFKNRSIYAASKGGVASMSRVIAAEWAPRNVYVNCIGPGQMLTPFTQKLFLETPDGEAIRSKIPLDRFGTGADLAGAVVFLASDSSDYIVGQTIYVDGGWLINIY